MRPVALFISLFFTGPILASNCAELYQDGVEPMITAPMGGELYEICYDEYAVQFSSQTRSAVYAAEWLSPKQIKSARRVPREGDFFEESHLPANARSHLSDFSRSGWDRGHLAPAGDFGTRQSQFQSFSLANVVPQSKVVNRGIWADIEESVRDVATKGSVYVVTGPIYLGSPTYLKRRVRIPTHMFKAIHAPSQGYVGAYLVGNSLSESYQTVTLAQLATVTGLDVFPALSDEIKNASPRIPAPNGQ